MTKEERACFVGLLRSAPKGPRIEFGVFKGATLNLMVSEGKHAGPTYGVDSFQGMAEPSELDIKDGWNPYPKGRLLAAPPYIPDTTIIKGFVPKVLEICPGGPFAFAHVDMDQYWPTWHALTWLFTRMLPGGIICCDDYFTERDWLAAGAINELAQNRPLTGIVGRKAWWSVV